MASATMPRAHSKFQSEPLISRGVHNSIFRFLAAGCGCAALSAILPPNSRANGAKTRVRLPVKNGSITASPKPGRGLKNLGPDFIDSIF